MKKSLFYTRILQYSLLLISIFRPIDMQAEQALTSPFFFAHLGVEDGLSQSSVMEIFQASDQTLWFATLNGLNQYDGYTFKTYQNRINDEASLSDNQLLDVAEDNQHNIWVATLSGLSRVDYQTDRVTRFYPDSLSEPIANRVNKLLLNQSDKLLAFTARSVYQCEASMEKVSLVARLDIVKTLITDVVQDKQGNYWVGTSGDGLLQYDNSWRLLHHYTFDGTAQSIAKGAISSLLVDSNNRVWIGFEKAGLSVLSAGKITHLNQLNSLLNSDAVRSIIAYIDDTVLVGTFSGLNLIDTQTLQVTPIPNQLSEAGSLSHYSVHSMLLDNEKTLWVGTYSAGLNYHNPCRKRISLLSPEQFSGSIGRGVEDTDGTIWFATEGGGLLSYNPLNKKQKMYPLLLPVQDHFDKNIIKSILIQGDSIYCTTHFGEVYLFSIQQKRFTLLHDFNDKDIFSIYKDSSNRLWIPTQGANHLVLYSNGDYQNRFEANGSSQVFKRVHVIQEIRPDVFLFGTGNQGLYLYDEAKKRVKSIDRESLNLGKNELIGTVTGIVMDSLRGIWVSTTKSGIYLFDQQLQLIKRYNSEHGFTNSYVGSMILDQQSNVWVATATQLFKLDPDQDIFQPMSFEGIPRQEFMPQAATLLRDGTLCFSGNRGVTFIYSSVQPVNPYLPKLQLNSLRIQSHPMLSLKGKEGVALESDQTNITIEYVGVSSIYPQLNRYAYKLEGVDNEWNYVGGRRQAYYSNLAPGKYRFTVKVCNSDNVWNPVESNLDIHVYPPLWRTWWAFLCYIILIGGVIYLLLHMRISRLRLEHDLRFKELEKEKIEELQQEQMRMFTNFSHELRTPLTLILNPLDELLQQIAFSEEVKRTLQLIKKNTSRLMLLVNNLMDVKKYDAGKMVLNKSVVAYHAFENDLYETFGGLIQSKEICFEHCSTVPVEGVFVADKQEIEKLFFNILSNALKFTPAHGKIQINSRFIKSKEAQELVKQQKISWSRWIDGEYLCVEVADSGSGIAKENVQKIFEPFYRSTQEDHQAILGTGIGLSLSHSIIQSHDGFIWATSALGEGTTLHVLLPNANIQSQEEKEKNRLTQPIPSETTQKVAQLMEEVDAKTKPLLLIVDDNEEVLSYLEEQLKSTYIIHKAGNGRMALDQIAQASPDLILSDVMMPQMSGIELCRQVKENEDTTHIPIILLTAKSMPSQIEEGWDVGADDYIVKPFHLSLLRARIKNMLHARARIKERYSANHLLKSFGVDTSAVEDPFLTAYVSIVKENITNPDFDVSVIYQHLGMSRANFYRKVKLVTGLSPIELIKNIRVEAAAVLLLDKSLSISDVAQRVGFSSGSYFARTFKSIHGISPTEYQEREE
jgi:signal transduction histidine kinase/ligand-binding sensor domain-containing protein/DNA-binding NarL/FixJ family response regulator